MKRLTFAASLCVVLCLSFVASAQTTKRAQLIKFAKELESAPFSEEAKENRGWAVKYLIETDEVHLVVCSNEITTVFLDKKNKFGSEILSQYMMGMAVFKFENPEKATDEDAAQLAGVESAIKAYAAMIAEKPKGKYQKMDDLVAMRDRGELTKDKVGGCAVKGSE